ncbi:hypothetical protein [Nocardia macrotermitis]|uniref:Mammalian cell entry protein n=1 Tax=Nocardia macrotermitis TaxID=2585198 RepID=A0A7K0D8Y6_9NOCA|nr:hypothetical protein [Nocardia macrotermitis]MQY21772.1 hypothetical protein [Nocardia macrotermitis]
MADNDADEPTHAEPSDEADAVAESSTQAQPADAVPSERSAKTLSPETADAAARTPDTAARTSEPAGTTESGPEPRPILGKRMLAWAATAVVIVALAAVTTTLVLQHRTATREQADRAAYLQAARQAVVDLTTISSGSADADIARILAASTGTFHDDFGSRSTAFTSVVKQAHVSTTGTVTAAGIESMSGDDAKVLVAATSKVTNSTGANNEPRIWRLRVILHRTDGHILVSNVDFVP